MKPDQQQTEDAIITIRRALLGIPADVAIGALLSLALRLTDAYPHTQSRIEQAIWSFKHEPQH